eukprot:479619_1
MDAFIVDKALVLIVAVTQFDEKTNLLEDRTNVDKLIELWRGKYNYDVYVCSGYCTKQDIIDFVDKHKQKLANQDYKAAVVHILSHGNNDCFDTSDQNKLEIEFIKYELVQESEFCGNVSLLKVLFSHTCRGTQNYSMRTATIDLDDNDGYDIGSCCRCFENKTSHIGTANEQTVLSNDDTPLLNKNKTKYSTVEMKASEYTKDHKHSKQLRSSNIWRANHSLDNMSAYSNCVTVYGNINDRTQAIGDFTNCICNTFANNATKMKQKTFIKLLIEIGRDLERATDGAAISTTNDIGTLRYDTIKFKISRYPTDSVKEIEQTEME